MSHSDSAGDGVGDEGATESFEGLDLGVEFRSDGFAVILNLF